MPRYWVMAPFEAHPSEVFEKVWQFDLANSVISLGFSALGDVSTLNRDELAAAVAAKYADKPAATQSLIANMFWAFYHEIRPGDLIITRRGSAWWDSESNWFEAERTDAAIVRAVG